MAKHCALGMVCDPYAEANATLKELQRSGFDMNELSIAGRDYLTEKSVLGRDNAGDRLKMWCQLGDFWGGLSGLLMGSAFYFIPGIGPVIVFGPLVSWIVGALKCTVSAGELSALGGGLHSMGIPADSIMEYENALKFDKFIVIAHGTFDEVAKAKSVLDSRLTAQLVSILENSAIAVKLSRGVTEGCERGRIL